MPMSIIIIVIDPHEYIRSEKEMLGGRSAWESSQTSLLISSSATVARFQVKGIEKCCRFVGSPKTLKSYISAGQRFQKKSLNKKFAFYLNYKM